MASNELRYNMNVLTDCMLIFHAISIKCANCKESIITDDNFSGLFMSINESIVNKSELQLFYNNTSNNDALSIMHVILDLSTQIISSNTNQINIMSSLWIFANIILFQIFPTMFASISLSSAMQMLMDGKFIPIQRTGDMEEILTSTSKYAHIFANNDEILKKILSIFIAVSQTNSDDHIHTYIADLFIAMLTRVLIGFPTSMPQRNTVLQLILKHLKILTADNISLLQSVCNMLICDIYDWKTHIYNLESQLITSNTDVKIDNLSKTDMNDDSFAAFEVNFDFDTSTTNHINNNDNSNNSNNIVNKSNEFNFDKDLVAVSLMESLFTFWVHFATQIQDIVSYQLSNNHIII
jgi:hypothetical protein